MHVRSPNPRPSDSKSNTLAHHRVFIHQLQLAICENTPFLKKNNSKNASHRICFDYFLSFRFAYTNLSSPEHVVSRLCQSVSCWGHCPLVDQLGSVTRRRLSMAVMDALPFNLRALTFGSVFIWLCSSVPSHGF